MPVPSHTVVPRSGTKGDTTWQRGSFEADEVPQGCHDALVASLGGVYQRAPCSVTGPAVPNGSGVAAGETDEPTAALPAVLRDLRA